MKKFERYWLVLVLALLALSMGIIKIFFSYNEGYNETIKKNEINQNNFDISVTPTIFDKQYPLKGKLPYEGKGFVIEEYTAPLTLKMVVLSKDETSAIKEASEWLNSFGDVIGQHKLEIETAKNTPTINKRN